MTRLDKPPQVWYELECQVTFKSRAELNRLPSWQIPWSKFGFVLAIYLNFKNSLMNSQTGVERCYEVFQPAIPNRTFLRPGSTWGRADSPRTWHPCSTEPEGNDLAESGKLKVVNTRFMMSILADNEPCLFHDSARIQVIKGWHILLSMVYTLRTWLTEPSMI